MIENVQPDGGKQILGGAGDDLVNLDILFQHAHLLIVNDALQVFQILCRAPLRRQIGHLRHQIAARLQNIHHHLLAAVHRKSSLDQVEVSAFQIIFGVQSVAVANFQQVKIFKLAQRLAHGGPIDVKTFREFPFRG